MWCVALVTCLTSDKTITVANKLILFATNDNLETYQLTILFDQYHQVI